MSAPEGFRADLIRTVQAGVPLTQRPFQALAEKLGQSERMVIDELGALSSEKILREISAVLEGSALGYDSALVAGSVPEDRLQATVEAINAHPTVSHNYLRNHHYNLWFTIAVPPRMGLERTLELLAEEASVEAFHPLRRTHTFKIGVNFDPVSMKNNTEVSVSSPMAPVDVGEREARFFRALQTPLPLTERPFDALAGQIDAAGSELIAFANDHLGNAIRRYVGTLRHRKLGVRENGMVVWRAASEEIGAAGDRLARAPEVSHCYARNGIEGFPYTLYSMVHGPTRESCQALARDLSREVGIDDYAVLFSEREFKKQRLRYFLPELDRWWDERVS
ncbi:MAG: Lrp/AsnC family transcriptional regulator [Deltaproteobacteria bacterium]|nr:Lrp/AsnC family transcriptional regulator [Deltaproteobacteria bacterium]